MVGTYIKDQEEERQKRDKERPGLGGEVAEVEVHAARRPGRQRAGQGAQKSPHH